MKTFKKIFASVMVTAMLATMGVSAFADNIQPRVAPCDNCENGMITTTIFRGDWEYAGKQPCIHPGGSGQEDEVWVRIVTTYYSCTECTFGESYTSIEEKIKHLG